MIARLRGEWEADYARWQLCDLSARRYVYLWADGVYLQARMEPQAECMLVLIGATPEGKKELVGFQVGMRRRRSDNGPGNTTAAINDAAAARIRRVSTDETDKLCFPWRDIVFSGTGSRAATRRAGGCSLARSLSSAWFQPNDAGTVTPAQLRARDKALRGGRRASSDPGFRRSWRLRDPSRRAAGAVDDPAGPSTDDQGQARRPSEACSRAESA